MLMDCHLDDVSLECIVMVVVFDVFDSHSPTLYWNEHLLLFCCVRSINLCYKKL